MPKFVADLSEDDDEVVVLPFVKPPPPMIVLSASEDEGEYESSRGDRSNEPPPKTKENVSRSTSSRGQRVRARRDAPSQAEGGSRRKAKANTSQNESVTPNQPPPTNIFHPSETAIMDTTTPNGSVEGSPVQSPSTSTGQGKRGKGSHSNLVKEQFASFLKDINLPPPPPKGRPSKTNTSKETPVEPTASTPQPAQEEVQGFVTVTPEKSTRGTKEKRVSKIRKSAADQDKQSSPSVKRRKTPMNLQYNLTTTPLSLGPEKSKSRGTKRTEKGTGSDDVPGTNVAKKRKKDVSSTTRTTSTEKAKSDRAAAKRKSPKVMESSDIPPLNLNHPGFPKHWTDQMKEFYGTIEKKEFKMRSIIAKMPDDSKQWRLSEHRLPGKRMRKECEICKGWGHYGVGCPQRGTMSRCIFCCSKSHRKNACPVGLCLFCGARQDKVQKTCRNCFDGFDRRQRPIPCSVCDVVFHNKDSCPDNWRKYHSITIDVEQMEKDLLGLKDNLRVRLLEQKILMKEKERRYPRALQKVGSAISQLEREIKEVEEKIKQGKESEVANQQAHSYVPKYEQYCCNCATKGHNYINCTKGRPEWATIHRVVPNKPYITIKKSVVPLDTPAASSTSTEGITEVPKKNSVTSEDGRQEGRKVVFDAAEEAGFVTVTVINKAPKEPQVVEGGTSSKCPQPEPSPAVDLQETPLHPTLAVEHQHIHPVPPPVTTHSRGQSKFWEDRFSPVFDERSPQVSGIGNGLPPPPALFGFQPRMPFPPPPPHPLFTIPPPQIWKDGCGRIQYPPPPPREVIQVPVPIPVREEDFERLRREGFPAQFQFPQFYQAMANMYPHQEIPPVRCPPNPIPFQQRGNETTTMAPEPMPYQAPGPHPRAEKPPSPDSTEDLPMRSPISPGGSSEIEFLGEVHNEKSAPAPPTTTTSPPSAQPFQIPLPDQRRDWDDPRRRSYHDYDREREYRNNWNRDSRNERRDYDGYSPRDSRREPREYHPDRNHRGNYRYEHPRRHDTNGSPQRPYRAIHRSHRGARRYFDAH